LEKDYTALVISFDHDTFEMSIQFRIAVISGVAHARVFGF